MKIFDILFGDIFWYEIINYLDVKEINNLKMVHPNFNKNLTRSYLEKLIILKIKKRLKFIFKDHYQEFMINFNDKAIISGSFIIQCILNENWNSDIDIFIPINGVKQQMTEHGNLLTDIEIFLNKYYKFSDYYAANRYSTDIGPQINWIRNYSITDEFKIQTIQLNMEYDNKKIYDYLDESFDFDICKNLYSFSNNQDIIKIKNLQQILNKKIEFKITENVGSTLKRYKKYKNRGFKFNNIKNYFDEIITKYENVKLFNIKKTNNDEEFTLIDGEIYLIKETWGFNDGVSIKNKKLLISSKKLFNFHLCGESNVCPINFCYGDEKDHFHLKGSHLGHGLCKDFIFIINQ